MFIRIPAFLIIMNAWVFGQAAFTPRSGAEAQAWRFYQQFKESKTNEARLKGAITQAKGDYSDISQSSIGGLAGIVTGDATDLANLRRELAIELALQERLLDIWAKTYFWRYGELKDIDRIVDDKTTGRKMDRVEYAIRSFPFYRDRVSAAAGSVAVEKGSTESWSHIIISLANVTDLKTADSPGWRNNGTSFTAKAAENGTVPIRVEIVAKGGVSYADYDYSVTIKTVAGVSIASEKGKLSKDGATKSYSFEWDPSIAPGPLSVTVSIAGGNPEGFIYYVSGTMRCRNDREITSRSSNCRQRRSRRSAERRDRRQLPFLA
ncbi:MAG: hypothetical protein QM785_16840 [Pyrinomonadaceae bacterium]